MMVEPIASAKKNQNGKDKLNSQRKIGTGFLQSFLLVGQFSASALFSVFRH